MSQSRSHVEELMKKQDRQNTEAAMKKGSDEHRIRGLQEQLDLKIRELLAVSGEEWVGVVHIHVCQSIGMGYFMHYTP